MAKLTRFDSKTHSPLHLKPLPEPLHLCNSHSLTSPSRKIPMAHLNIFFILLLLLGLQGSNGSDSFPQRRSLQEHHERFLHSKTGHAKHGCGGKNCGRIFHPIGYGADPTGVQDSSDAFMSCITDAFAVQKGLQLMAGITDLGGVVIDLQGGDYKIGKPIRFPPAFGNVVIHGGTLRASSDFAPEGYLIELSQDESATAKLLKTSVIQEHEFADMKLGHVSFQYEDITVRDILFDSNFRGGGIVVIDAVRTRIDNCFFIHFTTEGILVERGHETFISSSFLGQRLTAGGDPHEKEFSGTAIDLASNDNTITDVAIFSAAIGVVLRGQANILTGVHCYNKATYWGGIGVHVKLAGLGQTRIDNCYMDYTGILLEDPVQVHITNGFFLGNANIVLKSVKGRISGLNIVDNMFAGSGWGTPIVHLDESMGQFTSIDQVVIERNNVREMKLKSTVGKVTVAGKGTQWVANFTSELVFPNRISHLQYSFYSKGGTSGLATHGVTSVSGNVVIVGTDKEVDGVVSVMVDQDTKVGEKLNM
ncbi:polygalacturonase QRT3-like [Magnolia sinica]|uniref:polygalacturonase QRT3-like n=1 Tax=Magnolia sinica TaxID=86752 RepID=UPI00265ADC8F|nr:polygalacturonase QRT3-like [Magnolia sinica]